MTDTQERADAAVDDRPEPQVVARLAENFTELMRSFLKTRQTMLQAAEHNVEWTSNVVLRALSQHGPMRSGAIADCLGADPSTISRQTAAMVKDGLLERQSDPDDGRASILALTPQAHAVIADHDQVRLRFFADLVADWTDDERATFVHLLDRFAESYLNTNDNWMTEKLGHRTGSTAR